MKNRFEYALIRKHTTVGDTVQIIDKTDLEILLCIYTAGSFISRLPVCSVGH